MDAGIDWGWWIGIGAASALAGYLLVAGIVGSWLLTQPARSTDQRTPETYGWRYEPIEGAISRDGLRLSGWWIPAAGRPEASVPTVILVHGYADNKSGMLRYARYFHPGCNVVVFDLRACGASQGRRTTQGIEERHDLRAILDWLDRSKAPTRVIAFGVSMGGETALLAAAEDERIGALILDSTHDRLRTPVLSAMRTRHLPLGFLAFPVIMATTYLRTGLRLTIGDPLDHVAALGHRPLLILHGSDDDLDPPECAARLAAAAARASVPVELRFCPGAGHGHTDEAAPHSYAAWLGAFVRRALSPQRAAEPATVASSIPAALASSANPSSASSVVALS
ncbi:MAG TPA: alpha/beta hydrolase [Candidatus Limnocylindria bacterium]